ncbi:unnamed protein product, partial [Effrenium voratum]
DAGGAGHPHGVVGHGAGDGRGAERWCRNVAAFHTGGRCGQLRGPEGGCFRQHGEGERIRGRRS